MPFRCKSSQRLQSMLLLLLCSATAHASPLSVDFDSDDWLLENGELTTHLGRRCMSGTGYVAGVDFENGMIEVDMAVNGMRSYPGIVFRRQPNGDGERFYIRPHRAGLYPDALQYAPVFRGVTGWQLYHGQGVTAKTEFPVNKWVNVRMEIRASQARVFIDGSDEPALEIADLKHGACKGRIGLMGPTDGTAYFSNFRYKITERFEFDKAPKTEIPEGTLTTWEVSKPFHTYEINPREYPRFYRIFHAGWRSVVSEPSGLVNLSRLFARPTRESLSVYARTNVHTDQNKRVRLSIGYSDDVTVFLNGKPVYSGASGYQSRDPSFVGAIGYFDNVYLPLRKGINEVFLVVSDSFGGWGFMAKADETLEAPRADSSLLIKAWETPRVFRVPESVIYDEQRNLLYVSSFDKVDTSRLETGFISRLGIDGEIKDLHWIQGLDGPCGMALDGDKLYVVESMRGNLIEIDVNSGSIVARYSVSGHQFLNDVVVDNGRVLISDTSRVPNADDIYAFTPGRYDVFKTGLDLHRTNGLFIHDGFVIAGSAGDQLLKRVNLAHGCTTPIVSVGGGTLDGIRIDGNENYLVSHWEGKMFQISPVGDITQILDTSSDGLNCADFEFIKKKKLLVVPTFLGNRVTAYHLRDFG